MPPKLISSLKGRDLRALNAFRDRARAALGRALLGLVYVGRRPVDAPPELTAPRPVAGDSGRLPSGSMAIQPQPEPAGELRIVLRVERRDLWVEEQADAIALEVALEMGALVLPVVCTPEDLSSDLGRASRLAQEVAAGEALP